MFSIIKKLTKFFTTLAKAFASMLTPFKSKVPFLKMPGIKVPVCYLNPFFVVAYIFVDSIVEKITKVLFNTVFWLSPLMLFFELGFNPNKWNRWIKLSQNAKKKKLKKFNDIIIKYIKKRLIYILRVIFFMLAFSIIFVPLLVVQFYQNAKIGLRIIAQCLITFLIVGIPILNSKFLQSYPILMSIVTLTVYNYVRYFRIIFQCFSISDIDSDVPKASQGNVSSYDRVLPWLFNIQESMDTKMSEASKILENLGKDSDYFYYPTMPLRAIGLLFTGSWFKSHDDEPDKLYKLILWFLNLIDIKVMIFGRFKGFNIYPSDKIKDEFLNKFEEINSDELPEPLSSAIFWNDLVFNLNHNKEHKLDDKEKQVGGGDGSVANLNEMKKLYRKFKIGQIWRKGQRCRDSKLKLFVSSIYYSCIVLIRIILIPVLMVRFITSFNITKLIYSDDVLSNLLGNLILFLTIILIINIIVTTIIIFPNPRCNLTSLQPFVYPSLLMTVVFLPSFLITYFYRNVVDGCFDSYDSWKAVDKAFNKLIGASKKRVKEMEMEKTASDAVSDAVSDAASNVGGVISNVTNISSYIPM